MSPGLGVFSGHRNWSISLLIEFSPSVSILSNISLQFTFIENSNRFFPSFLLDRSIWSRFLIDSFGLAFNLVAKIHPLATSQMRPDLGCHLSPTACMSSRSADVQIEAPVGTSRSSPPGLAVPRKSLSSPDPFYTIFVAFLVLVVFL